METLLLDLGDLGDLLCEAGMLLPSQAVGHTTLKVEKNKAA